MLVSLYVSLHSGRSYRAPLLTFFLLSFLHSVNSQAQTIRYVRANPAGSGDGSSWTNATSNLQSAINSLTATGGQVWVANGLYKPTNAIGPESRTTSFSMRSGVAIYGGFAGSENTLSERQVSYPTSTTLSGNTGVESVDVDNSYHVLTSIGVDSTGILDGFVITAGNANGDASQGDGSTNGGGIYIDQSSIRLNNCFFVANSASFGGAISSRLNSNSSIKLTLRLTNCTFQSNSASSGGAIYSSTSGSGLYATTNNFVLINCAFQTNTGQGGAIAASTSMASNHFDLINCSFQGNSGVYALVSRSYGGTGAVFTNCVVFNNGGSNTFSTGISPSIVQTHYSLIDQSATGYSPDGTTLTTTTSPFSSTTSTQLAPGSLAVNSGDPASTTATSGTTDLAGNPRFAGSRIDMGAFEFQGSTCVGDLFSVQSGNWSDAAVWSCNRVPNATDIVHLRHAVTIPQNYVANARRITYDIATQLIWAQGGRLVVAP